MRHVLCYGDSNTWGFIPQNGARYTEDVRWTGRLQQLLGEGWRIHEAGLNARTTIYEDPFKPFLNGRTLFPGVLVSEKPLDVLILSLGTNDLKYTDAWHAAQGVGQLIDYARAFDTLYPSALPVFPRQMKILVVSPILVGKELAQRPGYSTLKYAHEESCRFAAEFRAMCESKGVEMVDAAALAQPSPVDCIHMEPEGHAALAQELAARLLAWAEQEG